MQFKTFEEELPKDKTWVEVLYGGNVLGLEYFVEMNNGMAKFADTELMEYVFPAGEEGITHWRKYRN